MKLKSFTYNQSWSGGHFITMTESSGLDVSLSDFQPSLDLIAMIELEAEAEIKRRREVASV